MRRRFGVLVVFVCGAVLASAALAQGHATVPSRLQVTASEFRLGLSRSTLRSGPAVIELVNLGEDDHDLAVRRLPAGPRALRIPVAEPGRVLSADSRLAPGRYRLWCTLADHARRGMHAVLVVRR